MPNTSPQSLGEAHVLQLQAKQISDLREIRAFGLQKLVPWWLASCYSEYVCASLRNNRESRRARDRNLLPSFDDGSRHQCSCSHSRTTTFSPAECPDPNPCSDVKTPLQATAEPIHDEIAVVEVVVPGCGILIFEAPAKPASTNASPGYMQNPQTKGEGA